MNMVIMNLNTSSNASAYGNFYLDRGTQYNNNTFITIIHGKRKKRNNTVLHGATAQIKKT